MKINKEWLKEALLAILLIAFGMCMGYALHVDNIKDACDQFIIDEYFTPQMQLCYQRINPDAAGMSVPFSENLAFEFNMSQGIK